MPRMRRWRAAAAMAVTALSMSLLAGCVSTVKAPTELAAASEQTDLQKRARIRMQLAVGYYEQKQLAVALDEIRLALQSDPQSSDAYNVRALIYMDMGELQLAEENFTQAIRLAPTDPDLSNNFGWFLCQNGRPALAIPYFDAALKNRSYQSPAKAMNNAGVCSMKLRDLDAAERYLQSSFQFDPASLTTSVNLARLYYVRGDLTKARFYIDRAIKADVMAADVLWLAIKINHKLDDKLAEAAMATQLRRRHPNSPEYVLYQRGAFDE